MEDQRPDPEKLLQRAKEEERHHLRGKLKIYLGAAPGVGKTYSMLQDAMAARAKELDVVVGIVESHGRYEIESMLKNFETLPRQSVNYKGKELSEFDLDGVLKRNPALVLIDEMAHTNVPGLRHEKRWQDIKEVLDCGIDVSTTLNVQHIESLNDVVSQIIHTQIKETVPDYMLEMANTIELVDLSPEDLLKRLRDGKVYVPRQAELATEHFFRKGNLNALRELALRFTAERVNEQVLLYRQGMGIKHVWPTRDKILVCVSHGANSAKLIRAASRLAKSTQTNWLAVYVDVVNLGLSDEWRNDAIQNLRLAEQLGAETRILTGAVIVKEILNFAREQNVSKIVIGKHVRSRWYNVLFPGFADEMVRESREIDVYVITSELEDKKPVKTLSSSKSDFSWKVYGVTVGIVAMATAFNVLFSANLKAENIVMVYLLGITLVATFGRMFPSVLACALSVLSYAIFFIPSFDALDLSAFQYSLTLLVMFLISYLISHLTIVSRRQTDAARHAERRMSTMHRLSRKLASARGVDNLLEIGSHFISNVFDSEVMVLVSEEGQLSVRARSKTEQTLNEKEQSVVRWVLEMGQIAGPGTNTLPFSDALYVPLVAPHGIVGVLRVRQTQPTKLLTPEQMHLLEACANQLAIAIEVESVQRPSKN